MSKLAVFPGCGFFFNDTATTEIYTLSLHDALPIYWCSPYQLADRMEHLANRMIATGTQAVAITSLWPRSNTRYNLDARLYAGMMERRLQGNPVTTFWLWDRRQAWRNYDGVHFLYHGYRLAMRYLISLVVWIIHHNLW